MVIPGMQLTLKHSIEAFRTVCDDERNAAGSTNKNFQLQIFKAIHVLMIHSKNFSSARMPMPNIADSAPPSKLEQNFVDFLAMDAWLYRHGRN